METYGVRIVQPNISPFFLRIEPKNGRVAHLSNEVKDFR